MKRQQVMDKNEMRDTTVNKVIEAFDNDMPLHVAIIDEKQETLTAYLSNTSPVMTARAAAELAGAGLRNIRGDGKGAADLYRHEAAKHILEKLQEGTKQPVCKMVHNWRCDPVFWFLAGGATVSALLSLIQLMGG
jgi:hypothetical protein